MEVVGARKSDFFSALAFVEEEKTNRQIDMKRIRVITYRPWFAVVLFVDFPNAVCKLQSPDDGFMFIFLFLRTAEKAFSFRAW